MAGNAGDSDKEFSFTVTLGNTSVNGTYGDMTFKDGVATFTLKDGETKTASKLPNGVGYTVEEADYTADGYVTDTEGNTTGTIVGDDKVVVKFTNTRNVNKLSDNKSDVNKQSDNKSNVKKSPAKTGDNTNLTGWLIMLLLSGIAIVLAVFFRKRSTNKR